MGLRQRLARHVFYPLSLWRSGQLAQLRYLREFERTQYLPPDELRDLQLRPLQRLLDHAYRDCPFYRKRFDRAGLVPSDVLRLEDLHALPPLSRADVQKHRDAMVARGWPAHDLVENQTGGSTGTPVSFFMTRDRVCSRAAATWRHNPWAGWGTGAQAALALGARRAVPAPTPR